MESSKFSLSKLRDIGWSEWDPIGLLAISKAEDCKDFADEYDSYLIEAAGQLRHGVNPDKVVEFD